MAGDEPQPRPGDLYVLLETAGLPVEWALLARDPDDAGRWLAVPADTSPLAGSDDVAIGAGEPGGPLALRCRFKASLPEAALAPERRSGGIALEAVRAALDKAGQVEREEVAASPLAREADVDPEYVDWLEQTAARAQRLAQARPARPLRPPPVRRRAQWRPAQALAAGLLVATVGLAVWVAALRREVERLSEPLFDLPAAEVVLGAETRGPVEIRPPEEKAHLLLILVLGRSIAEGPGRLELVRDAGRVVWRSPSLAITPHRDYTLVVPRRLLAPGQYRLRLVEEPGGAVRAEQHLEVRGDAG